MKLVIRIFNLLILAISGAAAALLFLTKPMTFNSNISLDVASFSKFVPNTEYSQNIDISELIGTKTIQVAIAFDLDQNKTLEFMNGDRDAINNTIINQNVNSLADTLREPVQLITDFTIRTVLKNTLKTNVTDQLKNAIANSDVEVHSTAEEIMDEVGMNDAYFSNFAIVLYDSANATGATVDSVTDTLFLQIDDALARAEDNGAVNVDGFSADAKEGVKTNLIGMLTDLGLVKADNTLKPLSDICYTYLVKYLTEGLTGKVAADKLAPQTPEEENSDYVLSQRLLGLYVVTMLPATFYSIVGYVSLGLFIGLFVFAALWGILFIITLIKTFTSKPWTIFGPWFWIFGSLQLVLGVGLTAFGKFIMPRLTINIPNLPLKTIILAPRTYALIPSILFAGCIVLAIVYAILRSKLKRKMKRGEA